MEIEMSQWLENLLTQYPDITDERLSILSKYVDLQTGETLPVVKEAREKIQKSWDANERISARDLMKLPKDARGEWLEKITNRALDDGFKYVDLWEAE